MSEVSTIFTSDSEQIERVYRRLEEQNAKLIEQNRALHAQTRQNHQEAQGFLGQQIDSVKTMALSYLGVQTAINGVMASFHDWEQVADRLAKQHDKIANSAIKAITAAGDLFQGKEVEAYIDAPGGRSREEKLAAYRGASAGNPAAPVKDRIAMAEATADAEPFVDDLQDFSRLASEIKKNFDSYSPRQAADLALGVKLRAGAHAQDLTSDSALRAVKMLVDSGAVKTPEEGFGTELSALHANLEPAIFARIAAAVEGHHELKRPGTGQPYTDADRAHNRFAEANAADRYKMLFNDQQVAEEMLGARVFPKLRLLKPESIAAETNRLTPSDGEGYLKRALTAAGETRSGAQAIAEDNTRDRLDASPALRAKEIDSARIERAKKWYDEMVDVQDPYGWNWADKMGYRARNAFGDGTTAVRTAVERTTDLNWPQNPELVKQRVGFISDEAKIAKAEGDRDTLKELRDVLADRHDVHDVSRGADTATMEEIANVLKSIDGYLGSIDKKTQPPAGPSVVLGMHTDER